METNEPVKCIMKKYFRGSSFDDGGLAWCEKEGSSLVRGKQSHPSASKMSTSSKKER